MSHYRYKSLINSSIIIFDEAHNITQFCETGYTFSLTAAAMNTVLELVENTPSANKWENVCQFLEEFFDTEYQNSFFQFFESYMTFGDVKELRGSLGGVGQSPAVNELLDFLDNVLEIIDTNTSDSYNILYEAENECLLCVCLDPSISLKNLIKLKARSILITSGTISPLSSLIKELDIPFNEILQNTHVIKSSQLLAQVVTRGSDGEPLESSFKNRKSETYLNSLGNTLINYMRIIPGGLLVFFPSYTAMDIALKHWREQGDIWSSMKKVCSIRCFANIMINY